MIEQKRNNIIIALCLMALILAAVVGVLLGNKQSATVASAATVDLINDGANDSVTAYASWAYCPDCRNSSEYIYSSSQATCTSDGYSYYHCDYCDSDFELLDQPALGHNYNFDSFTDGDCKTEIFEVSKCTRCGSTQKYSLGYGDHNISERETPATCNKGGKIEKYCTACGVVTETTETEPTYDHIRGRTEIVGASCTLPGTEYIYCDVCGEVFMYGDIGELGHDFSVELERVEYCMELGHVKYKCSRCDETKTEMADMLGHAYEFIERFEPTCEDQGYTLERCARCGYENYDYIDMLGHDRVERVIKEANCGYEGLVEVGCSRCDNIFETYTVDPTYQHNNVLLRVDDADCTKPAQNVYECTGCGAWHFEDIGEPLGHNYETTEKNEYCEREGYAAYECTRCFYTYAETLPAAGHNYENQIEYHAADCEHDEVSIYECTRCGGTIDKGKQKALGHKRSQRLILEATGEYPAIYERYCTVCGEVFETVTGEQIWEEENGGSSDDGSGDNQDGIPGESDIQKPSPKANALKILKMCLFFAYCWIALGLAILFFALFIKRLKQ